MKVALTALNSRFIHSNLAVRYMKAFSKDLNYDCVVKEFSINDCSDLQEGERITMRYIECVKEKANQS